MLFIWVSHGEPEITVNAHKPWNPMIHLVMIYQIFGEKFNWYQSDRLYIVRPIQVTLQ